MGGGCVGLEILTEGGVEEQPDVRKFAPGGGELFTIRAEERRHDGALAPLDE